MRSILVLLLLVGSFEVRAAGGLNSFHCDRFFGGHYTTIARRLGVEFLMARVPLSWFQTFAGRAPYSPVAMGLIPLTVDDSGKWAHQLIAGPLDSVESGVRKKRIDDWMVGLIFPVDMLDLLPFTLTTSSKPRNGVSGILFDSTRPYADEMFEDILSDELQVLKEQQTTDFQAHIEFHFLQPMLGAHARLAWIPAPLTRFLLGSDFPGEKFDAPVYEQQISQLNSDGIWTAVRPPAIDSLSGLNTQLRVGTWFRVIPDWRAVRAALGD